MATYYNVTGSTGVDVELLAPAIKGNTITINSITITNTHATADATVSLYLNNNKSNKKFYIIHTVAVPADTSLLLDNSDIFKFNRTSFGLYLTVGSSDTLDVLIN